MIGNFQRAQALARQVACRNVEVDIALGKVNLQAEGQELSRGVSCRIAFQGESDLLCMAGYYDAARARRVTLNTGKSRAIIGHLHSNRT